MKYPIEKEKVNNMDENKEKTDEQTNENKKTLSTVLSGEGFKKLIIIVGLVGIGLIFCSSFFAKDKNEQPTAQQQPTETADDYAENMQKDLSSIISSIEGVGKTKVLVTVERESQSVYATDSDTQIKESTSADSTKDSQTNTKNNYVIIKEKNGSQQALKITELKPKIKGVLIVCEGADSPIVKKNVIEAVTVSLDIPSSKVCVSKLS